MGRQYRETIWFMKTREAYGELSNMYPCRIEYRGLVFGSSEHLYQWFKFLDEAARERVRLAKTPMQAAFEGRDRRNKLRPDWDIYKEPAMAIAVREKFIQNQHCREVLLSTDGALLIELSYKDNYWGSKPDYSGENRLGCTLMHQREELLILEP